MIDIETFTEEHVQKATRIAIVNYHEERTVVGELPNVDFFDDIAAKLRELSENKLGVAAIENGELVGYMTCLKPWQKHFGNTPGTFSPIHAHGAVKENRGRIYSILYQAASEVWVKNGILSQAIALYAHDREAIDSFFWNGFGLRCIDAIRDTKAIEALPVPDCEVKKISAEDANTLIELTNMLREHLQQSPMYMPLFTALKIEPLRQWMSEAGNEFIGAYAKNKIVAYLKISPEGENFATCVPDMRSICGAYCLPEYRGRGIMQNLLNGALKNTAELGCKSLGVDFESFNPNARNFWTKYFTPYTYSVVRRIDERILNQGGII